MITEISILDFKGISKCTLNGLGKINLFIGKNDACKSTILEAMYYTLKEFTGPHLGEIVGRRSNVFSGARELWFNYDVGKNISTSVVFEKAILEADIGFDDTHKTVECSLSATEESGIEKRFSTGSSYSPDWSRISRVTVGILANLSEKTRNRVNNYIEKCQFVDSSHKDDVDSMEKLLTEIKNEGKANEFGEYLHAIFGKGRKWEFIPQRDVHKEYRVAFIQDDGTPLFLSGFGDGIRYGTQIVGTALTLENTGLFIEEIENNQHPDSLRKLIDFLVDASFRNDLQLFVTTHNDLTARFLMSHFRKEEFKVDPRGRNVKYFHVTRNDNTGEVDCTPVDLHNSADANKVVSDLFGLENARI
ncbi:MAG: AAA family ATPase [Candidatus Bathyarchaeota archaeon]|nr:AAA family ATPase [Candidatus Bathyarchaeota archaeon]